MRRQSDEDNLRNYLCRGVGAGGDHLILRDRDADHAREHEAGLSGADRSDRSAFGDRIAARLRTAAGVTCRTDIRKFGEESEHHPVKPFGVDPTG